MVDSATDNRVPRHKRISVMPALPIAILAALVFVAVAAPYLTPYTERQGKLREKLLPPSWVERGVSSHPLGTDFLGRDVLTRMFYGARISLSIAALAIFVTGTFGTFIGIMAGYLGGRTDTILMRITDMALAMPLVLMAIVLVAIFGASYTNIILVIVLLLWPRFARQIRGETLAIKQRDFVELARIVGCSHWRIIRRHIFPNLVPSILVLVTLQVGWVILLEATLSFLGVGIPKPTPAWGVMVADARGLVATAWWVALFPGICIAITVLSFNLLGDWIRDYLDPKLRQV